jgi:hypothetical protein
MKRDFSDIAFLFNASAWDADTYPACTRALANPDIGREGVLFGGAATINESVEK